MVTRGTDLTIDDDVRAALARSSLGSLSPEQLRRLLAGASRRQVPAGATIRQAGDGGQHLELIIRGFIRILVFGPDGRTLTIRYVRPGELMGAVSVFRPIYRIQGSLQAVVDVDLLILRPGVAHALTRHDPAIAGAFLDELSERIIAFVGEIPRTAFATVRARVARHLLDLASERQHDATLRAPISQQQLADAVGSVREVVVRALRDLRADGLIRTGGRGILILDPERLWAVAMGETPAQGGDQR